MTERGLDMTNIASRRRSADADDGFGIVEIVVSMLILAILSMALLPVLIMGLKQSAANTTLATATQLVNDRIRAAQALGPVCTNVATAAGLQSLTDPRGVQLQATTVVGSCPVGVGTVNVTTTVVRLDTGATLASASTLVLVS
jgi:prepilin-type N-terminal cleavage/methylation domain-containing protein